MIHCQLMPAHLTEYGADVEMRIGLEGSILNIALKLKCLFQLDQCRFCHITFLIYACLIIQRYGRASMITFGPQLTLLEPTLGLIYLASPQQV